MPRKQPYYQNCTVTRRYLVRTSLLNVATSEHTPTGKEWKTGPCNVPLFGEEEKRTGKCKSCAKGWTHPENYPVESVP